MPGRLVEPNRRYRNDAKNPHLVDWYFSARLDKLFRCFFKDVLDSGWIWNCYEWQSRTTIHSHGVVKFKNEPGLPRLVAPTYSERLADEKMAIFLS